MAAQTDLESVIFNLPSLLCEMERHYLSDNIDMCGFFVRRGEDFVGLLRVCASVLAQQNNLTVSLTREIQELISRLESNVFHFQARQDFLLEGDSLELRQSYTCETVQNGRQGRPVYKITEFQIWGLRSVGFTWRKIASFLSVSERTLRRRRQEMGWPMRAQEFSQISDDTLDIAVRNILSLSPNSGERMVLGALRGRGLLVQRNRVRESIFRVDPVSRALRRFRTVQRRVYNVTKPNALWHQDGNHKLIRWRFVIHGAIDGFSRVVVFLCCSTNNKAETVLQLFRGAVRTFGLPTRMRCDHGTENIGVARFMLNAHGVEGSHVLTGLSVHNQRIERLWVDVVRYIVTPYRNIFTYLESFGLLDQLNELHLFALHYVYQPRINRSIEEFVLQWNHHGLSSERCQTPLQLMIEGLYNCLPDLSDTETVSDDYGIDDLAPMPELQTDNNIQVPRSEIELSPSQHDTLALAVNPLSDDQNNGVNLYLQAVGVIANFVHQ